MSKRIFASLMLALVLMAAVVAPVAAGMKFCFTLNGKQYCIDIPVEYHIWWKVPPDKMVEGIDVSRVVTSLKETYRANPAGHAWLQSLVEEQSQWYLVDAQGRHVVLLDMASQAAVEVEVETQVGY